MTKTLKAASAALQTLRDAPAKQASIYKTYRKKVQKLVQHPYLEDLQRNAEIAKIAEEARAQLGELQTSCINAQQALQQKANARKVVADDQAYRKVRLAMASGKWTVNDLMKQLVKEGDRAAISALRDELVYLARQGRLDGPAGDYDKQVAGSTEIINAHEASLYDESEQHAHSEVREAGINLPFLGHNARKINAHLDLLSRRPGMLPSKREGVEQLYAWQGTPENATGQTFLDLSSID